MTSLFDLPDWIEREAWDGFCDMRDVMWRSKKIPWTERARKIILRELADYNAHGYDVNYMLDEAVSSGWRKPFLNGGTPRVLRDQYGTYKITAEGTRKYIQ